MEDHKISEMKNLFINGASRASGEGDLEYYLEKIISVYKNNCPTFKLLSVVRSSLIRITKKQTSGLASNEEYELQMNKITSSIIEAVSSSSSSDFGVRFDYSDGVFKYYVKGESGSFFEYIGELRNAKPYGHGKALYKSGEKYIGNFKNGLKDGEGRLYGRDGSLIIMGVWKNNEYLQKGNVKFYSEVHASAGRVNSAYFQDISNYSHLDIPGLPEKEGYLAFPVVGDSMTPKYHDGDIVICRKLYNAREIDENTPYVVITEDNIYLKLIQLTNLDPIILRLISINHIHHQPFEVELEGYAALFSVKAVIRFERKS